MLDWGQGKILSVSLRLMNTLGVECEADELVEALSVDDIERAVHRSLDQQLPLTVLGGGSNVILLRRISGVVLRLRNSGWHVETQSAGHARIWVGAGTNWHELTQQTLMQGLSGLENLSLIPGTAGAAPIQNIGAFGVVIGERVERVDAHIDIDHLTAKRNRDERLHAVARGLPKRLIGWNRRIWRGT